MGTQTPSPVVSQELTTADSLHPDSFGANPATPPLNGTLVYIAPHFPGLHQTYVQREVRVLRQRGWKIQPVGLNISQDQADHSVDDLRVGAWTLYERGATPLLIASLTELTTHPIRSLRTLSRAARDAILPGERLTLKERAKLPLQAAASLALSRRLRPLLASHIHCHFAHAATTIGMYTATQLGIPFSFTGHANDLFQRRCLLRRKLQRAAFVGCISEWHRGLYESIAPEAAQRCRLVRCGVDVSTWTPPQGVTPDPGEPLRITTVARLVEKKGIDTLIEAMALRRDSLGRSAHVTIAGDGPLRSAWVDLANRLGCAQQITWLGDVGNSQIRRLMYDTDVFVLPCRTDANGDRDGIPVVLMEAMACAIPVISGDLPAVRELVTDGITGLLVPANNPSALADALARLEDDPDSRHRLGRAGRAHVLAEFALDVNINRLEQAIRESHRNGCQMLETGLA